MNQLEQFQSLETNEMQDINGGIGFLAGVGIGFVTTVVVAGVNEAVKDATGKDIFDHAVDGAEAAWDTVSGWFN
ncbi:hypothetical protein [Marinicrinis lubricantis]|uniref:Class IIb bacteriocin, lactobin A/cerein 7B family n=1 Tax=Marinicrinis lubricantis TaxID=2086470 RepID=A0ABW1IUX7_9BACL